MGTPSVLTTVSNQVIRIADTNQVIKEIRRVKNVKGTFFIRFSSLPGRIFQTGKKNKFVAKIPIGPANNELDCSSVVFFTAFHADSAARFANHIQFIFLYKTS